VNRFFLIPLLAAVFIAGVLAYAAMNDSTVSTVQFPDGELVRVEVADDPIARIRGLSGRDGLDEGTGMLFDFGEPQQVSIWMKDMRFSIDILWIENGEIVWVVQDAPPPTDGERVASFTPAVAATHVLELPAGFVRKHNVEMGDALVIRGP
jgi:hypothetical protein